MQWRVPFFDLSRELRDLVYKAAVSANTHHRNVTLYTKEGSVEIVWAANPLPVGLLSSCRTIYNEVSEVFAKELAQRAANPQPVRLLVPARGLSLLLGHNGIICHIQREVARIEAGSGVNGQYELMREEPRVFHPRSPVYPTMELDYLIIDCAEYIARIIKPNQPTYELCIVYDSAEALGIASRFIETFVTRPDHSELRKYQVSFGVFKKDAHDDDVPDMQVDIRGGRRRTLWDDVESEVNALPQQQWGQGTFQILDVSEEEWKDKWVDDRPPTSS